MNRPQDPRANVLCTSCNWRIDSKGLTAKPHCGSDTCPWWTCPWCGAQNDSTGSNNITNRDGTKRKAA
ncbi:MAG: hypothetical protein NVV70_17080 [Cellulomonas sp.]|nr:hypothetical protein [Cellulomonas sp.]MCR6649761.1 hypothetical protein [Cellulomonas sp.]